MSERNDVVRILGNRLASLERMADEALRLDLMGAIHTEIATAIADTESAIVALASAAAPPKVKAKKSAPPASGEKKKRGRPKKSAQTIEDAVAFATTIAPPPLPSPFDTAIQTNGAPASP